MTEKRKLTFKTGYKTLLMAGLVFTVVYIALGGFLQMPNYGWVPMPVAVGAAIALGWLDRRVPPRQGHARRAWFQLISRA